MTEAGDGALHTLIAVARAEYARSLVAKADALEALVNRAAWTDARRAAHRLRGSAGVYGFAAVGAIAAMLEELLSRGSGVLNASNRASIEEGLGKLRAEAELACRDAR